MIRAAQFGTGHGHAAGKLRALRANPDVELVGVYEPDPEQRALAERLRDYAGVRWLGSADELLGDPTVQLVAIEGRNDESLDQAQRVAAAGKHLWYDKPAGDDWAAYLRLIDTIKRRGLYLQMGYMLRYHPAFRQVADWARAGFLGPIYQLRAHMSTFVPLARPSGVNTRSLIARHRGGMFYDLGGHMLDQVVWILGRPTRATTFLRNDATPELPQFADNTLGVLEFERAIATVEISALEVTPPARRFELYGLTGSAIVLEHFEERGELRLCLDAPRGGFQAGEQIVPVGHPSRQRLYELELEALVRVLRGEQPPDRPIEHEVLVQETLLRTTGGIPGG